MKVSLPDFDEKRQREIEDMLIKRLAKRWREQVKYALLSLVMLFVFAGSFLIIMAQLMITNLSTLLHIMTGFINAQTPDEMWNVYATIKLYSFGDPYISYLLPLVLFFVSDLVYKTVNPKEPDLIIEFCKTVKKRMF